ncbi:Integrator complex subunit 11, partial [Fragariocoptes setiger]
MLDCGMHMGFNDDRRFPDFSYITREGSLTEHIDCVIISHFHLDHCGALPYMSEMVGYQGPIYMTQPTKAIAPILLEDFRKITVERKGESNFFTSQMIKDCMRKVIVINLHQTIQVDEDLEIKCYYAGHVLGAGMFLVKSGQHSVVYTGDFNMTPDRHLGSAWIEKCRPDLLITESTYATTIRDSKRCRERDFLMKVHDCVDKSGKVLIPVFALGRAQELCILLDTYWERMNIKVPIYFAAGLTEKATNYYKMFITWTNEKIKRTFVQRNMFDFKHIKPFDRSYIDNPGAMVVFATPGMLHAGLSLQIFRKWAPYEQNMVIMPGYCVSGTVGQKILSGARRVEFENKQFVEVNMKVEYMSFSAHADSKGIMQLISQCEPKNVLLVHGEASKMKFLKAKIIQEFKIGCFDPANGETVEIPTRIFIPVDISVNLLKRSLHSASNTCNSDDNDIGFSKRSKVLHGALVMSAGSSLGPNPIFKLVEPETAMNEAGLKCHNIKFTATHRISVPQNLTTKQLTDLLLQKLRTKLKDRVAADALEAMNIVADSGISLGSCFIKLDEVEPGNQRDVYISWYDQEEGLGSSLVKIIQEIQFN